MECIAEIVYGTVECDGGCENCNWSESEEEVLDTIKAIPLAYKGMTNGEVIKTVFDVDEIQVTENTVIVRVKGSFCAKMQFLLDWWTEKY